MSIDIKGVLTKIKPTKKTVAIMATVVAVILGAQSGVSMEELIASADKIAPIINAIVSVVSGGGGMNSTIVTP